MKNKHYCYCFVLIAVYVSMMVFVIGCGSASVSDGTSEVTMEHYYTLEDFQSLVIGQSTHSDLYDIAPSDVMLATSYGGLCEYPKQGGGYIHVKLYGPDLIVGAIEEVSTK